MSEENKNQPSHDSPQEAEPKTKQDQELSEQDLKQVAGGKWVSRSDMLATDLETEQKVIPIP